MIPKSSKKCGLYSLWRSIRNVTKGAKSHGERSYSTKLGNFSEENMDLLSDIIYCLQYRYTLFLIS